MIVVNKFFEDRVEQLFDLANIVEDLFTAAGVEYRLIGGLAVYLYVEQAAPDAGRLTRDIDIAVRRQDLARIAEVAPRFGLELRHVAGVDMLVRTGQPSARRAVHLVFASEKVRAEYLTPTPDMGPANTIGRFRLIPLADLVRMKLTSFRLKDQTHIKDLEEAGLLTPEIEAGLTPELLDRLNHVKASS